MPEIQPKSEQQKMAEAEVEEFREELGPFVVAAETSRMPMLFSDATEPGNPIIFANDAFLDLTGYKRRDVLGQQFNFMMVNDGDPVPLARLRAEFETASDIGADVLYRRKDGSAFWANVFISPVRDAAGAVVQHFSSFVDLSRHKQEQAESEMLIDELNHRVKNTLATVQSIAWQALRKSSDPVSIRDAIESRLFSLARSHDLLTRENWKSAGLHDLIATAMEPFGVANGRAERFRITGANVRLLPKATLALGIAFNELATNALKYGAFSNDTGSIIIEWTIEHAEKGDRLVLCWIEKDGPPVAPPELKGFGSQVIERGLAHELEGVVHLDYRPGGVVCTIDIPAPRGPS